MSNLKLSSRMHILIAVSAVFIAIGMAVGVICHFLAGGFFNWGADSKSFKSVEVECYVVEFGSTDKVEDICEDAFDKAGVSEYSVEIGEFGKGNRVVYKFSSGADATRLAGAVEEINAKLSEATGIEDPLSTAYFYDNVTQVTGGKALTYLAIAVASVIALQFIYFAIRYKLTMAFAALLSGVHNLAVFAAILAVTRIPVGTYTLSFALILTLLGFVLSSFFFDRMRKRLKADEEFAKADALSQTDKIAAESLPFSLVICGSVAACALLIFVLTSISALSATVAIGYAGCALAAFVSALYGTEFFIPPVYARFKRIGDGFKANRARSAKKTNQKDKAGE